MRRIVIGCLMMLALWGSAGSIAAVSFYGFAGAQEQRTILVLKSDGASILTNDNTCARLMTEQMVKQWVRMQKQRDGEEDENGNADQAAPTSEKPFSDEELARALRKMAETQAEEANDESGGKFDLLQVSSNTVRTVTSRSFGTVPELLRNSYQLWGQTGLMFQNIRFEKDTNDHLLITFAPYPNLARQASAARQQWKSTRFKSEWKLILPGKVLSSSLPIVQDNSTSLIIDGEKEESIAAALKLRETNIVITAELGGLNLPEPLDSKALFRMARQGLSGPKDELPVTKASPGFLVEPLGITTIAVYRFSEGEKLFKNTPAGFSSQAAGTTLRAKIYAPRGRTIRSVSGAKLLTAIDDKGRPVSLQQENLSPDDMVNFTAGGGGRDMASAQVQFMFALPQPDAQSIEKVTGEAVVATVSQWKSVTVANLAENTNKEIDLAELIPGAKLVITKAKVQNQQINILAQLTGPSAIRNLDVQCQNPGAQNFNSWANDQKMFADKGEKSTRTINVNANSYSRFNEPADLAPVQLLIRLPEDLRRERVEFTMTGLDLL